MEKEVDATEEGVLEGVLGRKEEVVVAALGFSDVLLVVLVFVAAFIFVRNTYRRWSTTATTTTTGGQTKSE